MSRFSLGFALLMALVVIVSISPLKFNVQRVKTSGTIYIRADGSVEGTDKIISSDIGTYTFIDDINDSIVVERSNIIVDGAEHALHGSGYGSGFYLYADNITVKRTNIKDFETGIHLFSSNNIIFGNGLIENGYYGVVLNSSSYNSIFGNNVIGNGAVGIYLCSSSSYNIVSANNITNNGNSGILLLESSENTLSANRITNNTYEGVYLANALHNILSENSIVNNGNYGTWFTYSSFNNVSENDMASNGINLQWSPNNILFGNNVTGGVISFWESSSNAFTGNKIINGSISLYDSSENKISRNDIKSNNDHGIYLTDSSSNNAISRNKITDSGIGIYLWGAWDNIFSENTIADNLCGIESHSWVEYSYCSTISGNNITNNNCGIRFYESSGSHVYHNNFMNNTNQFQSSNSYNTWDSGYPSGGNYWSDYTDGDAEGDGIGDTPYVIDANNRDRYPPMHLWSSLPVHNINTGLGYTTIQEAINVPETLDGHAIFVEAGTYYENVFLNKTVSLIGENSETTIIDGNKTGSVVTITVNNVNITGFTVQNSGPQGSSGYGPLDCGIFVSSSSEICITENVVTNNSLGIYFDRCSGNTLRNNNLTQNTVNLLVGGDLITYGYLHMLHDIDETNIVNGSPIYYWIDKHDKQIPYDAGCIYLVNSTNITVKDIEITNSLVCLVSTNNSIVENVKVNFGGISLGLSQDNRVTKNTLTNGTIALTWSLNNTVAYNVMSNSSVGIYLYSSYWWTIPNKNFIVSNTIANCAVGISIPTYADCNNNTIYHNNFINNTKDVDNYDSINSWDNGAEGNYWSNYPGVDSDPDGIGDSWYEIDSSNIDHYPLMGMFTEFNATSEQRVQTICNSTISSFQFNGTAISFNVSGENDTAGFCRICIPTALMNGTYRVFVNGTEILPPPDALPCSNETYSYLYFNYAHSIQEVVIIPEFSSFFILPLFMIATLLTIIIHKRKQAI